MLEHFQSKPAAPPFIMMTAHEGEKHKAYAKQIGVADYLHKPFTMERLLQSVSHTLGTEVLPRANSVAERGNAASIKICCPSCGVRIKAPVQLVGQTRPCPGCGHSFVVREIRMDEGPRLLMES